MENEGLNQSGSLVDLFANQTDNNNQFTSIELGNIPLPDLEAIFSLSSGKYNNDLLYLNRAKHLEKTGYKK